jgi:DNA-directed RNA polymerase subunit RPC12/RpoP
MGIIKITGYNCERCTHEWTPRSDDLPTVCPKCKSPYWNKEKQ